MKLFFDIENKFICCCDFEVDFSWTLKKLCSYKKTSWHWKTISFFQLKLKHKDYIIFGTIKSCIIFIMKSTLNKKALKSFPFRIVQTKISKNFSPLKIFRHESSRQFLVNSKTWIFKLFQF